MDIIQKITVQYIPLEDRLQLAIEAKNGQSYVLWLTARLSFALVVNIMRTLDKQQPANQLMKQKPVQQWEQSAAQQAYRATSAVKAPPDNDDLIQSIDVSVRGESFTLIFRGVKHATAQLTFTSIQMRQWLQIVYDQFFQAKWPMTAWPEWFSQMQTAKQSSRPPVLH